jgi:excisionase family DNA binding protein
VANSPEPAWGSIQETADQLGVSPQTIRRWIRAGRISAKRMGPRLVRVELSSLVGLDQSIERTDV